MLSAKDRAIIRARAQALKEDLLAYDGVVMAGLALDMVEYVLTLLRELDKRDIMAGLFTAPPLTFIDPTLKAVEEMERPLTAEEERRALGLDAEPPATGFAAQGREFL